MKVAVVADHHYYADGKGNVYVPSVYGYEHWKKYLAVFDEITVICRGNENVPFDSEEMLLASGPGVNFAFVPDFTGMKQMAKKYFAVRKQLRRHLADCDLTFVRVPSPLSRQAVDYLIGKKKVFASEVVADPAECFNKVPFSKLVKRTMRRHCEQACSRGNGAAYVTREALQRRYPARARLNAGCSQAIEANYSDANLTEQFYSSMRNYDRRPERMELMHIANKISGTGKGYYVCLQALAKLNQQGIPARLTFVGDGPEVPRLRARAEELGISENVCFAGRLVGAGALQQAYLQSDVVLLPSRTEGLPRSLLEAMACGVVCLGSNAGGIPELLEPEDMFPWQDSDGFADRLAYLWDNWQEMAQKSARNRALAEQHSDVQMKQRQREFYLGLQDICRQTAGK